MKAIVIALLVWLGSLPLALAEEIKGRLSVDYNSPTISVEARGVSLVQVLRKIGADVGFDVEDHGVSPMVSNFSVKGAHLEKVLRRLLSSENYAIIYRGEGIERIVLLRPKTYLKAGFGPQKRRREKKASPDITQGQKSLARSFDSPSGQSKTAPPVARGRGKARAKQNPTTSSRQAGRVAPTVNAQSRSLPTSPSQPASVPPGLQHRAMQRVRNLADALDQAAQDLQNTGPNQ